MVAENGKNQDLDDFLKRSFTTLELDKFLKLEGYKKVAEAVNPSVGVAEYCFAVVQALDRRGLIDAAFFDCLMRERPMKVAEVRVLRGLWVDENKARLVEALAKQVKSATTLVDLAWCIGKAVVGVGYKKNQADRACAQYLENYEQTHAHVKILGMAKPVELASIYTEVRIVSPTSLRGYRTQEELQESFVQKGRSLAGHNVESPEPRPALAVANDEKYKFLNLLGTPGAGKSTFLRYIGLSALQGYRRSEPGKATS